LLPTLTHAATELVLMRADIIISNSLFIFLQRRNYFNKLIDSFFFIGYATLITLHSQHLYISNSQPAQAVIHGALRYF
jgi:hypothetical protein